MVYELGTLGIFLLGLMGLLVATSIKRWCIYGRATLVYFAIAWLFYGCIRVAIVAGMDREAAGNVVGLGMTSIAVTVASIVFLHTAQHWMARRCRGACWK